MTELFQKEDYFDTLPVTQKAVLSVITDYAVSLGYKAKKDAAGNLGFTFRHPKIKKTIVRFTTAHGKPVVRFRFYASHDYSLFFHKTIRATKEEYDFRYTCCYACGHCDGTQESTCRYAGGRQYFRCGAEMIELFDIAHLPVYEFQALFKTQHAYYLMKP